MANIDKPFITVEDLNTTLLMFKKGLKKGFTVNTQFMTEESRLYNYEFLTIEKTVNNAITTYTMQYPVEFGKSKILVDNYSDASITYSNNSITVEITNEDTAPIFTLWFGVVPENNNNTILTDLLIKKYFYTSILDETLSITVFNSNGSLATGKDIYIANSLDETEKYQVTTGNDGVFEFSILEFWGLIAKGENIFYLYEEVNNTLKIFSTIHIIVYPYIFEFIPSGTVYKDALNDVSFDICYYSPSLVGDNVTPTNASLKVNNKEYTDFIIDNNKLIFSDVNLYGFHNDMITLNLILEDTDIQLEYNKDFRVNCEYATFNDVITLSNPSPATAIVEDEEYSVLIPIDVDSDLNLIFEEDATLTDITFNINNGVTFKLNNGKLDNCNINVNDGILNLNEMEVYNSENPIILLINTESTIDGSYFHDNIGEDIVNQGKLTVINSNFLKQDVEKLNPLRPAFISVNGETNINNNQFTISYEEEIEHIGLGYVMFSINENAMLNTNKGNTMKNNNTFNKQKNKGTINVQFNNKTIDCQDSCFTWTVQNTNTVYHNNVRITEE